MEKFVQSLDSLVESFNTSFTLGQKFNKQLKLLEVYIKGLYSNPEKFGQIDTKNHHYIEYQSPEFENVLKSVGFIRIDDILKFEGSLPDIPVESLISQLEERRYLSFSEIAELVKEGKRPPGIQVITENPIGLTSSPVTQPPKKPWES